MPWIRNLWPSLDASCSPFWVSDLLSFRENISGRSTALSLVAWSVVILKSLFSSESEEHFCLRVVMPSCICPRRTAHLRRSTVIFLASFARRWLYLREENCCVGHDPSFRRLGTTTVPRASDPRQIKIKDLCTFLGALLTTFYEPFLWLILTQSLIPFISGEIRHKISSRQRCVVIARPWRFDSRQPIKRSKLCIKILSSICFSI